MNQFSSTEEIIPENNGELVLYDPSTTTRIKKKKSTLRTFVKVGPKIGILLLIWGHFGWATYYFIKKTADTLDATTCSGYGFWMILMIFIHFGLFYKFVIKEFLISPFLEYAWEPSVTLLAKIPWGDKIFYVAAFLGAIAYLIVDTADDRQRLMPLIGLVLYLVFGFALSSNRKMIPWRTVIWGLILQFVLGLLMIRWTTGRNIFDCVGSKVDTFLGYAVNGSTFVYGDEIVNVNGVFAFKALSTIYFLAFMINILYYYGIMQAIVTGIGDVLQWIMGTSICESVNSAANIFLGQSEAPLLLKPYLQHLTDSEIHSIMTSGFATVSGTVLAAYISFGASPAHLIISSVMSAPAALCYSKLLYPETQKVIATRDNMKKIKVEFESVMDAAAKGATDASQLVIGIISSIIAFVSFVYFVNGVLSWFGILVGFTDESELWTLELILGKIFIPITYTMGVDWAECEKVGQLIGIKTMVNEFVAFSKLDEMNLTPRSKIIATYSICGFANPSSIGIQIAALGTLMPNKKEALTRVVFRAFIGGCVVCFMTACIAALLIPNAEALE